MEATRAPWATAAPPPAPPPAAAAVAVTTNVAAVASLTPTLASSTASAAAQLHDIPPPSSTSSTSAPSTPTPFHTPVKAITSPHHLTAWKQSEAYADVVSFILHLNDQVRSKASSTPHEQSDRVRALVELMERGKGWVADIPPIQQAMRFGNKAFRTWHQRMMESLPSFLSSLLGPELIAAGAATELSAYLDESFGNQQRIDYGTGHELNFVLFLCCVNKMGLFIPADHPALVFDVFTRYVELMELIQLTYWLEPAGSKGSWGLDDYQFLCFLWGSSQLIGHPDYPPSMVLNPDAIAPLTPSYLYFQAVHFITRMKTGPFSEHSALLHSIAQLPSWAKVNAGLIKMYEEEVMNKFPIVQHVRFGSLLTMNRFVPGKSRLGVEVHSQGGSGRGKGRAAPPAVPAFDAPAQ